MLPIKLSWQLPNVHRLAWQIIIIHTLGLILVLGITTLTLFSKQQNLYQTVLPFWKSTERYQLFLDSHSLNYNLFDPTTINPALVTNLKQLQIDYHSLSQTIQLGLTDLSSNGNVMETEFWQQNQTLWQKQLELTTHRHTVIQFQLCLTKNYLELIAAQNSWLQTLQNASSQNQLQTIKNELNQAKSQLDNIQTNLGKLDQCLQILPNLEITQTQSFTSTLRGNYQQYQLALTELITGIDNLDLQKIQQADQLFNSAKINTDTVKAFDYILKNIFEFLNKQEKHLADKARKLFLKQKANFDTLSQWTLVK